MAIIRKDEIHNLSKDEIDERINELKMELTKERAQIEIGGTPKNPGRISEIRKTIARLLTERNLR